MKMTRGTLLAALLLALPVAAQRPWARLARWTGKGPGAGRGRRASDREGDRYRLERRDSLRLSGEQVQQLEALRTDMQEGNADLRDQMQELREEAVRDRGAVRERMEDFRAKARELREGQQGRLDDILSQDQRDRLGELMWRSRPPRPDDRGRGARGRGFRSGAGRFGGGGLEMRAYLQGLRDGLRAGARFRGGDTA
jgi:hypothetical protein